jgi:macrolide-specific efflux system membrane fusion protein
LKKQSRRVLFLAFLGVIAVGVWAWWNLLPRGNPAGDSLPTVTVTRRTLTSSILATGAVKPQVGAEVRVGTRISGKVERLYANIGDIVKKGQVIAELEKEDLEANVSQRTAELQMAEAKLSSIHSLRPREIEKAEAEVSQWSATVELSQNELTREDELLKHGITSQQDYDRAKEQLTVSRARLAAAQKGLELAKAGYDEDIKMASAELERAKASLADAKVQLSYATITAPIDGVIASVSTQEGETVAAGLNAPTFVTIIDLNRLQVDAFVDEVDIGKVEPGQRAIFTVDSFPDREFEGKVAAIYPKAVIQENVVNYDVVVQVDRASGGFLRPEMTANVTVFLEARENVLSVPNKAIKREGGKSVVYVFSDGKPQPRNIKVGWKDSQYTEVLSGLSEGETVLLDAPALKQTEEK